MILLFKYGKQDYRKQFGNIYNSKQKHDNESLLATLRNCLQCHVLLVRARESKD